MKSELEQAMGPWLKTGGAEPAALDTPRFYVPPAWCKLCPRDHFDGMGGCWGVSSGLVSTTGILYCVTCEYFNAEPWKDIVDLSEKAKAEREKEVKK